jgi:hypothetical protein
LEDIDLFDADVAEKVTEAIDKVVEEAKSTERLTSLPQIIRKQCNAVFDCFNTVFGEGTDKKVFGNKVNLKVCLNAFAELSSALKEQKEAAEKEFSKYSPNRAQRRGK